jgi:MATE family multidrug resistance protein
MATILDYQPPPDLRPPARRPVVEMLTLAGPTIAQMASYNVMQFIDTWMLSHLGEAPPTAASNAGMIAWASMSLGIGVLFVVCTLVSQSFGRGEFAACGQHLWQGLWFSFGYALLIVPLLPLAGPIFVALGHGPELIPLETCYFQIVIPAAVLKLGATALGQYLLAINRPGMVFAATAAGVSVNVAAAWMMVLGGLGVAPQGVAGAAWAQNLGVAVELAVLVTFVMLPHLRRSFHAMDCALRREKFVTLLKIGLPSGLQVTGDAIAWSLFLVGIMGLFGQTVMAANTFVLRYWSVSFMPVWGLTTAVTALVGRYIGMGRHDLAERRAYLAFVVGGGYMVMCGLVFLVFRHALIGAFSDQDEIVRIGGVIFIIAAIYQVFDAMYMIFSGALRGAGDTLVPGLATLISCWLITVIGGWTVARLWHDAGPIGPWSAATVYGVLLGVFMVWRFARGGWRRIRLERGDSSLTRGGPPA